MYGKNRFVYHASLHLNTVPNQLCLPWTPVLHLKLTLIKLRSVSHRNQGKLPLKTAFYKMYYWNEEINSLGTELSHTKKNKNPLLDGQRPLQQFVSQHEVYNIFISPWVHHSPFSLRKWWKMYQISEHQQAFSYLG